MTTSKGPRVLAVVTVVSIGIVAYIHYSQNAERERMRNGVLRDKEVYEAKLKRFQQEAASTKQEA